MILQRNSDYDLTINDIIKRSGDSVLADYNFSDGILTVKLEADEFDGDLFFCIRTDRLDCRNLTGLSHMERNCRIEILKLNDRLKTENGFYIPSKSFSELMKECRKGLNLAYGMKASDKICLFNVVGYSRLLTCIIASFESDIEWHLKY